MVAKLCIECLFQAPQRVFEIRRWSLGLRRWMRGRTRQGKPGEEIADLKLQIFEW